METDDAIRKLEQKLLSVGGTRVIRPAGGEPDLAVLLERGLEMQSRGSVRKIVGFRSECHKNVALHATTHSRWQVCTGYVLDSGAWRQHSWLLNTRGRILETTHARERYWGVVLSGSERERFLIENESKMGTFYYACECPECGAIATPATSIIVGRHDGILNCPNCFLLIEVAPVEEEAAAA